MKKSLLVLLSCLLLSSNAMAEEASPITEADTGILSAIAGENGTTYVNLFDLILDTGYNEVWTDYIGAVVGEENALGTADFMKGYISADVYGEAAIEAYGDRSNGMAFDCFYIGGVDSFTMEGDTITANLKDGTSETHTYKYIGQYNVGEGETMVYNGQEISVAFPCDVYQSTDEAGEFNYFFFRDDTMEETYHIEFRYGKDLEELQGYFVGPYAYWLAAGFDIAAEAQTQEKVIALFCLENMDYSAHTDAALKQLKELGFEGKWQADLSAFGEAYADTDLYFIIDENGHGETMMNGDKTADFEAYAYDNGAVGDGEGIYVAYSNLEYEPEWANYTLAENETGDIMLTLDAEDGTISYVKVEDADASATENVSEGVIEITSAEELAAVSENLSGSYILAEDIDLGGAEWTPIGTFAPAGESEEEQEMPDTAYAFTGTFDGNGHTISNYVIDQPEGMALGLFGCIANAEIKNLTVENATVDGTLMVSAVVGYAYSSTVSEVVLNGATVTAHPGEYSAEGMYGGIAGAGMNSVIEGCYAAADIVIPNNTANAGIVGGGLESTSVIDSVAFGSITAGDNVYGIGGVAGCGFGAEEFTGNAAENVTITVGNNATLIGGIVGYIGGYEDENYGIPVTAVSGCVTENVSITTDQNPGAIGGIVGGGFYSEETAQYYGAPFDAPSVFTLEECESDTTVNGEAVGLAGEQ